MTATARWRRQDLGYCSNVHPGEEPAEIRDNVARRVGAVREWRGLSHMAAGLWLPAAAAHALDRDPAARDRLREALDTAGIRLTTANGFPHGGFHGERVKEAVYRPDWSTRARLDYTTALARVLAACGEPPADDGELTLSTLPVAARGRLNPAAEHRALGHLAGLAAALAELREVTGRRVRVCLEPEPGCLLERAEEAALLLGERLPAVARKRGLPPEAVGEHLGVCYDVCHQAVMFEPAGPGLATLAAAGVTVGKVQVSSALRIPDPADPEARAALAGFAEPRYLHQVRWRDQDGRIGGTTDLDAAMEAAPRDTEWRVHFHVPVQAATVAAPGLSTTRGAIDEVLATLAGDGGTAPHLEVETYTWSVLPESLRPATPEALTAGLGSELAWLESRMAAAGLLVP